MSGLNQSNKGSSSKPAGSSGGVKPGLDVFKAQMGQAGMSGFMTDLFKGMVLKNYAASLVRKQVTAEIEKRTPQTPVTTGASEMLPKRKNALTRLGAGETPQLDAIMDFIDFAENAIHYKRTGGMQHAPEDAGEVAGKKAWKEAKRANLSAAVENVKEYLQATVVSKVASPELREEVTAKADAMAMNHGKQLASGVGTAFLVGQGLKFAGNMTGMASGMIINNFGKYALKGASGALKGASKLWLPISVMTMAFTLSDLGKQTRDPSAIKFRKVINHHVKTRAPKPQVSEIPEFNDSI